MRFGPLAPDKARRFNDEFLVVADGVRALENGYRPFPQWQRQQTALPETARGGATFTGSTGATAVIAGSTSGLYRAFGGGWEKLAGGFSTQGDLRWRFAQFGGLAIATNGSDPIQKIDLATNVVAGLGGLPPKFEMLAVVKDFLVGGVRNGNAMHIGWSGANDAEWWTTGQRQADKQILPSGGRINGLFSGEFGLILQRDRLARMDYVGGNTIFEVNEVSSNIGCTTVHSTAQWGNLGFFYSDEGFMLWNGSQPIPIGREFVDREFAKSYTADDWHEMSTAIDPKHGEVIWAMPDRKWVYNWPLERWTTTPFQARIIFSGVTKGVSLDEQDPAVGALDDNIDGAGLLSFDDKAFAGGMPQLYAFNSLNELGAFTGTPMAATFTGNEMEITPGARSRVMSVRPETDVTTGIVVTLTGRQRLGDLGTSRAFSSLRASGFIPARLNAKYVTTTVSISAGADWTYINGLSHEVARGGRI